MTETALLDANTKTTLSTDRDWYKGKASENGMRVRFERRDTNPPTPRFDATSVYQHVLAGDYDLALDLVFEFFEAAFSAKQFGAVDQVLATIDVVQLDEHVAFGLLSASYPAKRALPSRAALVERVEQRLIRAGRTPSEAESLLRGQR